MFWLLSMSLFLGQSLHETDSCGTPGYLDNFTYHPFQRIRGRNLHVYRDLAGVNESLTERCEELCLNNSQCVAFESGCAPNTRHLSAFDMYDIPLVHSHAYDFYNRVYDCGCPPNQGEHISISYTFTTDGSVFEMTCKDGAVNNDLPRIYTCTSDGWGVLENAYSCTVVCGTPAYISRGTHNGTLLWYNIGDVVNYTCSTGYVNMATMTKDSVIQCQSDGTWEEIPMCIIDCGAPRAIKNAVVTDGDIFIPGQSVQYTCNTGFVMTDTKLAYQNISCKADGTWDNVPSCKVTCEAFPSISNAMVPPGDNFIPGDNVTYTCDANYVIIGTKSNTFSITCQNDGSWTSHQNCTRYCGSPPTVTNSKNNSTEMMYAEDEEIVYTCDTGYVMMDTLLPNATLTCLNTGLWDIPPVCSVNCGSPDAVRQATVTSGDTFTPGQTVTYTCKSGYVIPDTKTSSKSISCKDDGEWETKPSCIVNCGRPSSVQNAFIPTGSVYIPGDKLTITCDPSYVIVGTKQSKATLTCGKNGNWDQNPRCTKDCGPPPVIINSTNDANSDVYVPNEQVTYTCDNSHIMLGSLKSQAALTCHNNGLWSDAPICIVNCGAPLAVQHATKSDQRSIFTPGDYVTWTCDRQHVVQATNIRSENVMCQGDGTWTANPTCIAYCGEHPEVDHAQVQGTGNQQDDIRTYTCDVGHTMVGTATITCQSNSQWEDAPICPADCEDPPILNKGTLAGSENLENYTRNATCEDGYVLEGKSTIKCQTNGEWEELPQCTAKEVYSFKQSMFGSEKSPISQETGIAMVVAILLGILLIGIGMVYFYNLCIKKRKMKGNKEERNKNKKDESIFNIDNDTKTPPADYPYLPVGSVRIGGRSWMENFF